MRRNKTIVIIEIVFVALLQSCQILRYKPLDFLMLDNGATFRYENDITDYCVQYAKHIDYPYDSTKTEKQSFYNNMQNYYRDYYIRNGVQQNLLLSQILRDYEQFSCYRKTLPYKNTRYKVLKYDECNLQYQLPYLIPAKEYELSMTYEKVDLKYTIGKYPLEFYRVKVGTCRKQGFVFEKSTINDNLQNEILWTNPIHKEDNGWKEKMNNLLVAVTIHPTYGLPLVSNLKYEKNADIFYLSPSFYSYNDSRVFLYALMLRVIQDEEGLCEFCHRYTWGIKSIQSRFKCNLYPYMYEPQKLIPYVYIMSYGDYEPEDVFFEKKHFKQFYYTFNSLRDGKNYRLHYNARNGKFVKYKEVRTDK